MSEGVGHPAPFLYEKGITMYRLSLEEIMQSEEQDKPTTLEDGVSSRHVVRDYEKQARLSRKIHNKNERNKNAHTR